MLLTQGAGANPADAVQTQFVRSMQCRQDVKAAGVGALLRRGGGKMQELATARASWMLGKVRERQSENLPGRHRSGTGGLAGGGGTEPDPSQAGTTAQGAACPVTATRDPSPGCDPTSPRCLSTALPQLRAPLSASLPAAHGAQHRSLGCSTSCATGCCSTCSSAAPLCLAERQGSRRRLKPS